MNCHISLGIRWDAQKDIPGYSFTSLNVVLTKNRVEQRRAALRSLAVIDSLRHKGYKMILRQAWIGGLRFPAVFEKQVGEWIEELPSVARFEAYTRCYKKEELLETAAIHTFTDASRSLAYGAVVYIRNV